MAIDLNSVIGSRIETDRRHGRKALKYMQDMSKINTKYQAAAGPAQARPKPGAARSGAGRARLRAWAGPAAAWYFVFILDILDISWIYLYIFLVFFLVT